MTEGQPGALRARGETLAQRVAREIGELKILRTPPYDVALAVIPLVAQAQRDADVERLRQRHRPIERWPDSPSDRQAAIRFCADLIASAPLITEEQP